jgi:SpoVK/Ycf46/Vps4 family AAA+-type ATPase
MTQDTINVVNNLEDMDEAIKAICKERNNYHLLTRWTQLKKTLQEMPALKADVEELKQLLLKLGSPPLVYAIYLGASPGSEREIIVGVGSSRLEVSVAKELETQLQNLTPGQIVVLNEKQNVVAIRNEYAGGDTAEVVNIITTPGEAKVLKVIAAEPPETPMVEVQWREDEVITVPCNAELSRQEIHPGDFVQVVQVDQQQRVAVPRVEPRLHVKSGGTEGVVVEISRKLFEQDVKIGDIVRIEPGLKFAFEKLPSYETGGLTLEEVPDVTYDDIGGLDEQIGQIYDAIELPYLSRAEFEQYQLSRPKGILLYGPPGCGKTMVAKAVANSLTQNIRNHLTNLERHMVLYQDLHLNSANPELVTRYKRLFPTGNGLTPDEVALLPEIVTRELTQFLRLHDIQIAQLDEKLGEFRAVLARKEGVRSFFLNVKGPELLDKYVGETEHRIRKIFEEARRHATYYTPVVIFFDEMEAMFRTRGSGHSSDIETTIVPQFLSELDGVESTSNLVIIGASNRQDMIDPAILRPKRLDVKVKVDRPLREAAQDIFAMYLVPTLPLNSDELDIPTLMDTVGVLIFRTAYSRESELPGNNHIGDIRLPPGCDFRLALSLQASELDELATLPVTLTIRDVLAMEIEGTRNLPWAKLNRFKPGLTLDELVTGLRNLPADSSVAEFVYREWVAEAMILATVDLLYSPTSTMSVLTNVERHTFALKDFMSGAVIANIVDRAKRQAIKRILIGQRGSRSGGGISLDDLSKAARQEFEENKEQLGIHKLHDIGKFEDVQLVEIHLKMGRVDPWSEDKLRLYKTTSTLVREVL